MRLTVYAKYGVRPSPHRDSTQFMSKPNYQRRWQRSVTGYRLTKLQIAATIHLKSGDHPRHGGPMPKRFLLCLLILPLLAGCDDVRFSWIEFDIRPLPAKHNVPISPVCSVFDAEEVRSWLAFTGALVPIHKTYEPIGEFKSLASCGYQTSVHNSVDAKIAVYFTEQQANTAFLHNLEVNQLSPNDYLDEHIEKSYGDKSYWTRRSYGDVLYVLIGRRTVLFRLRTPATMSQQQVFNRAKPMLDKWLERAAALEL